MDAPRYTREEWEEIQAQEWARDRRRFRETGGVVGSVMVSGDEIRGQSRESLRALIDTKLAQLKLSLLHHIERRDE